MEHLSIWSSVCLIFLMLNHMVFLLFEGCMHRSESFQTTDRVGYSHCVLKHLLYTLDFDILGVEQTKHFSTKVWEPRTTSQAKCTMPINNSLNTHMPSLLETKPTTYEMLDSNSSMGMVMVMRITEKWLHCWPIALIL